MSTTGSTRIPAGRSAPRIPWKSILVPTEHGGWGFLAEPIVLGLGVAFSLAGFLLALGVTAAFLARQPLRLVALDRRKGKRYPRTVAAERALAALVVLSALCVATAALLARGPMLFVLGLAAPLAALALAVDLSLRGRSLLAELAAPLALALVAAAIAVAAGRPREASWGLAALLAIRALTSIPYVRARLRLEREGKAPVALPVLLQIPGVALAVALAARGVMPVLGAVAVGVLGVRAAWGLSPIRPRMTAKQVGFSEIAFGTLTVILGILGWRLGF